MQRSLRSISTELGKSSDILKFKTAGGQNKAIVFVNVCDSTQRAEIWRRRL